MGVSICVSLQLLIGGRVGTSAGSITVTTGSELVVLSRSSVVLVRFSALEL